MSKRPIDHQPDGYLTGRASVPDLLDPMGDGGRDAIHVGACSLTEWLVWDWSKQIDDRLDAISIDTFDLADRVHYLNATIITVFIVLVVAASIILGVLVL